ncbi:MAG: hydroxymethylglutaryl-CoA lyase [Rhodothermaceae bacterium]|nr:MAG: hydroxymethylglutaryl-CoA lyase [Rhodothermaceae bacterium]
MPYPAFVELCEVGPRDGFQFEEKPIPTDLKVAIIEGLVAAGLRRIQVTSFVHPKWVPQMADAEEVVARLPAREEVVYTGLALNLRGLERAHAAGLTHVDLSIATNETHSRDNANMTVAEGVRQAEEMIRRAHAYGMQPQLGLQTVFGYAAPGDTPLPFVVDLCARFAALGVESISLADSTGMANPVMIRERVTAVQEVIGDTPLVLHLHDTRGLGLANVVAALACGVARFDTSLGGMGGCPFIPGATGNIATEDTVYLLDALGVPTGVDLAKVAACTRRLEAFLGKRLPGKMHRLVAPAEAPAS